MVGEMGDSAAFETAEAAGEASLDSLLGNAITSGEQKGQAKTGMLRCAMALHSHPHPTPTHTPPT